MTHALYHEQRSHGPWLSLKKKKKRKEKKNFKKISNVIIECHLLATLSSVTQAGAEKRNVMTHIWRKRQTTNSNHTTRTTTTRTTTTTTICRSDSRPRPTQCHINDLPMESRNAHKTKIIIITIIKSKRVIDSFVELIHCSPRK